MLILLYLTMADCSLELKLILFSCILWWICYQYPSLRHWLLLVPHEENLAHSLQSAAIDSHFLFWSDRYGRGLGAGLGVDWDTGSVRSVGPELDSIEDSSSVGSLSFSNEAAHALQEDGLGDSWTQRASIGFVTANEVSQSLLIIGIIPWVPLGMTFVYTSIPLVSEMISPSLAGSQWDSG